MHTPSTTAIRTARPLVFATQMLFVGLMAIGCAPQPPAQPAPQIQAQAAPQTGVAFLGYLVGKHGQQLTGHDIRNTPPFSTAYRALLRRNKLREAWLTHFNGPGTPVRKVAVSGAEYLHVNGCKAHSCGGNNIEVLYSHETKAIYARLTQNSESRWLGDPSDEIKQAFTQLESVAPPR
ncbi:MAG: Ivy family c-type lysozyme inhibitor [Humidesulfovibrio sp.]|nr:Ivy family c-type lysozyme inhibitor [Humidesulfovibrio sp.]